MIRLCTLTTFVALAVLSLTECSYAQLSSGQELPALSGQIGSLLSIIQDMEKQHGELEARVRKLNSKLSGENDALAFSLSAVQKKNAESSQRLAVLEQGITRLVESGKIRNADDIASSQLLAMLQIFNEANGHERVVRDIEGMLNENFSNSRVGLTPDSWQGTGLDVQSEGGTRVLQRRSAGKGTVSRHIQGINRGYDFEIDFKTNGYVNRHNELAVAIVPRSGGARTTVKVVDRSPGWFVVVNGQEFNGESITKTQFKKSNKLKITNDGKSVQVVVNGHPIHAIRSNSQGVSEISLSLNNSNSNGSAFPTIENVYVAATN